MTNSSGRPDRDEIERVAYAIWEAEGRPAGHDHEHWMRARQLVEEGRGATEYPPAAAPADAPDRTPRPVQPGFEAAAPGMVPRMKAEPERDLPDEPRGRFASQLADAPETPPAASGTPGPRNPEPLPPTNAEGYVAVPSVEDAAGAGINDDPQPPSAENETKSKPRPKPKPRSDLTFR